jgi:glycosyltransferase involved in cell wall biosynthesis
MNALSNIRILMTADTVGGVWTYASGLASSLATSGAHVCLVTMGPRPRADQREMLPPSVQVVESDLALEWQDPEGRDIARAREFLAMVESRLKPDIIHLNSYREATFAWQAPVVVVAHSCVNSWAQACEDSAYLAEPKWQHYTSLVAEALDQADAWVSPSRAFGDVVCDLYRPRTRCVVIRNGGTPRGPLPKNCEILAAGRMWDRAKNLPLLAAAGEDLDWPIVVAGATSKSAESQAPGIELLGEIPHAELVARMQAAAIFVSPARYEPFGLSVLEAAGAGCALVLSDIPGFRELWDGAAVFVSAGEVDGLRGALIDLCADSRSRAWLQQAALTRAKHYSMQQMTAEYGRLYRRLLSGRSNAGSRLVGACA